MELHEMADPGGPAGQGVKPDFTGDTSLGQLFLGIKDDGLFFNAFEFHGFPSAGSKNIREFLKLGQ
jgi:hypothetical protein